MEIKYIEGKYVDTETGEIIQGEPGELNMRIVYDKNTVIHFGKHKGKTILEIGGSDPGYLKWMRKTGFKVYDSPQRDERSFGLVFRSRNNGGVIRYPAVMMTDRGLERGSDVMLRDIRNHLDNHMMDKHPEIFDASWEEGLDIPWDDSYLKL